MTSQTPTARDYQSARCESGVATECGDATAKRLLYRTARSGTRRPELGSSNEGAG